MLPSWTKTVNNLKSAWWHCQCRHINKNSCNRNYAQVPSCRATGMAVDSKRMIINPEVFWVFFTVVEEKNLSIENHFNIVDQGNILWKIICRFTSTAAQGKLAFSIVDLTKISSEAMSFHGNSLRNYCCFLLLVGVLHNCPSVSGTDLL